MEDYAGFRKAGSFTLASGGEDVYGELYLAGAETTLTLYSPEPLGTRENSDIFGLFFDQSKVSLIDCVRMSSRSVIRGSVRYHCATVFPHYVIFGDEYLGSSDRAICKVSFTVDDAATLFYDLDAFGLVLGARPQLERILAEEAKGFGRGIETGEHPYLFYFTGKYEIFAVDTALGNVSATHNPSYSFPGPEGIHVDNTIALNVAFASDKTIDEAIESVLDLLRFLEVIAGRPQTTSKLKLFPARAKEHGRGLDVYWCMAPSCAQGNRSRPPHPVDLPIQAAMKPEEFTNVLARWLERRDEWRSARSRFSKAFSDQRSYNIDRIVGAANIFDILPPVCMPGGGYAFS